MARRRSFIDRLPLAPVFALLFGTAIAIVVAAMPQWRFEQAIAWTGLGEMLSVARPPLGIKARLLAVAMGFALVAILVWLAVSAVERLIARPVVRDEHDDDMLDLGAYVDSLPPVDAPRRPIFADKELGAPFMSDEALTTAAVPAAPLAPVAEAPMAALEAPLDVAEFDLPPLADESPYLPGESSIDTLIRRLEAGMARRAGPRPPSPPSSASSPAAAMRDMMTRNRETDTSGDTSSTRALDTLERLAARRMAG